MSIYRVADRVKETSTSTGSGSFSLAGAPTGFQTFNTAVGTGVYFTYAIVHQTLTEWEVGLGYLSGSTTLVRDTIFNSSSGGAVSFSAGTKDVFITQPANWGVTDNVVLGNSNNFVLGTTGSTQIGANTANSTQSVTIGYNASTAGGSSSVAVGYNSAASAVVGVAVGASSNAQNTSVAVGGGATGNATDTVAIGYSANASSTDGVAVGRSANVSAASGVAIGRSASVTSSSAIAIGPSTTVNSGFGIAIGTNSGGTGQYGINIGRGNTPLTFSQNEISIGTSIASTGNYSISIGSNFTGANGYSVGIVPAGTTPWPSIAGSSAVGIGSYIFANSQSVAIGDSALASSQDIAIGAGGSGTESPSLAGSQNIALGYGALTGGGTWNTTFSTAIGYSATVRNSGGNNIAIGRNAVVQRTSPSYNVDSSIALGYGTLVSNSSNTLAIGTFANTNRDASDFSVAVGFGSVVSSSSAVAIGYTARAGEPGGYPSSQSIAIGFNAQALTYGSIAIGPSAIVNPPYDSSVVIGNVTASQAFAFYISPIRTGVSPVGTQYTLKWDSLTKEVVGDSGGGGGATLAKCCFDLQAGFIYGSTINNNVIFVSNPAPGVWQPAYGTLLPITPPYNSTPAFAVSADFNATPYTVTCYFSNASNTAVFCRDFAGNLTNAASSIPCNFMVPA